MIIDLSNFSDAELPPADIAILGAGAIGLLAAKDLSNRGFDVLVIESGGMNFEERAQALNCGSSIGRPHNGISTGRARVVGGTTTLWGGQLVPFQSIDFESRPWVPNSGWPINFEDVSPYYDAVFELLKESWRPDDEIWNEVSAGTPPKLAGIEFFLTRWLREANFRQVFRKDLEGNNRFKCLIHANATNLNWRESDGCVESVTLKSWDGLSREVKAKLFIVSNGTIEAIRLMLNSAEVNSTVPWRSNRWLGRGFHDHLDCKTAVIRPRASAFSQIFDNIYVFKGKYQPKMHLASSKQHELQTLNIAASIIFESSFDEQLSNLKYLFKTVARGAVPSRTHLDLAGAISGARLMMPLIRRYLHERRAFNLGDKGVFLNVHCEQLTCFESHVSLDHRKIDAMGVPSVRLNWHVDGREIDTIVLFTKMVAAELRRAGLAELDIQDEFRAGEASALDQAKDSHHQGGGLRMGYNESEGVVDRTGLVFGTQNLYVAGAVVFPTSGHANSTLTAMALTLRTLETIVKRMTH